MKNEFTRPDPYEVPVMDLFTVHVENSILQASEPGDGENEGGQNGGTLFPTNP